MQLVLRMAGNLYLSNQHTITAMTYILLFALLVAVIGLVTHRLNTKTPCDHAWEEHDAVVKCTKCAKHIPNYNYANSSLSEAA